MAQDNDAQKLDVNEVLQRLASFNSASATPAHIECTTSAQAANQIQSILPPNSVSEYDPTQPLNLLPAQPKRHQPPVTAQILLKPSIDVSSIIEWKPALRHVNKLAAENDQFELVLRDVCFSLNQLFIISR